MRPLPATTLIVILLALFVSLTGCSKQTIIGSWESTDGRPVRLDFAPDGKIAWRIDAHGYELSIDGRYTYVQDRITIEDFKIPPMVASALEQAAGSEVSFPVSFTATVSFKNDKEIVISGSSPLSGAYTRVPSAQ